MQRFRDEGENTDTIIGNRDHAEAVDAKRGAKTRGNHPSILSRWQKDETNRASQVAIGWTETYVKYLDYISTVDIKHEALHRPRHRYENMIFTRSDDPNPQAGSLWKIQDYKTSTGALMCLQQEQGKGVPPIPILMRTRQRNALDPPIQQNLEWLSHNTNLRVAHNMLLFATSKEQFQKLLCDFKKSTEKVGLRIHPEKTKTPSNQSSLGSDSKKEMQIGDVKIEILTRGESVRYLGQTITFRQQETTEIKNRIRAAWATFHKYGQELISKNYVLKHRLQLFDAPITPTICYASGTWAPTKEHERMIQSTQRKNAPTHHTNKKTKRS